MNEEQIRQTTRAYLVAYDEAMKQTRNPNIAMQAAFVVMQTLIKQKEQAQADPLMSIIGAMMVNAKKEEDDEQTENNKVPK